MSYGLHANCYLVKPMDIELLKECAAKTPRLVTIEDNVIQGGFGSAVLEALTPGRAEVLRIGIPDSFVEHGAPHLLYDSIGLSAPGTSPAIVFWRMISFNLYVVAGRVRGLLIQLTTSSPHLRQFSSSSTTMTRMFVPPG